MYGELIPLGGGDPIPLLKKQLLIGRRESCDIVLRFANVSAHHCQLFINGGYWYVRDMKSRNGVKVNGIQVQEKRIDPGDDVCVAKHKYELMYSPVRSGRRRAAAGRRSAERDHAANRSCREPACSRCRRTARAARHAATITAADALRRARRRSRADRTARIEPV